MARFIRTQCSGAPSALLWGYLLLLPIVVAGGLITSADFAPPHALAWLWPQALIDPLRWGP